MSESNEGHWRMNLGKYLDANGGQNLKIEYEQSGPTSAVVWKCTIYIDGVLRGESTSSQKKVAKEAASKQALQSLCPSVV